MAGGSTRMGGFSYNKNKNVSIEKTTTRILKSDFFPTFNADEFVLYFRVVFYFQIKLADNKWLIIPY